MLICRRMRLSMSAKVAAVRHILVAYQAGLLTRAGQPGRSTAAVIDAVERTTSLPPQAPSGRLRIVPDEGESPRGPARSAPSRNRSGLSRYSHRNPSCFAHRSGRSDPLQCCGKQYTKLCACSSQTRHHCSDRTLQDACNLLIRETFIFSQQDNLAKLYW
jgi:hypothetical protein